jgi:hypothetical protein
VDRREEQAAAATFWERKQDALMDLGYTGVGVPMFDAVERVDLNGDQDEPVFRKVEVSLEFSLQELDPRAMALYTGRPVLVYPDGRYEFETPGCGSSYAYSYVREWAAKGVTVR